MPCPAGPVRSPGLGPAAAPVAHVGLVADEDDVEGRDAHVQRPQDLARRGVELEQAVGQVAADVEPPAVAERARPAGISSSRRGASAGGRGIVCAGVTVPSGPTAKTLMLPLTLLSRCGRRRARRRAPCSSADLCRRVRGSSSDVASGRCAPWPSAGSVTLCRTWPVAGSMMRSSEVLPATARNFSSGERASAWGRRPGRGTWTPAGVTTWLTGTTVRFGVVCPTVSMSGGAGGSFLDRRRGKPGRRTPPRLWRRGGSGWP